MASFDEAVDIVFANEGGMSANSLDPGGVTNFGISQKSYPDLDIKKLTRSDAKNIYFRDYWSKYPFAEIASQPIANKLFDMAVNMGPSTAIRLLQQSLQHFVSGPIVADGIMGPLTLAVLKEVDEAKLLGELRARAALYHCDLVINQGVKLTTFMLGWLRRDMQ